MLVEKSIFDTKQKCMKKRPKWLRKQAKKTGHAKKLAGVDCDESSNSEGDAVE